MSVVELRQHVRRYITSSKQDILKDLGSAKPKVQGWDIGIPQVDSIASPTMPDVRDMWHRPMKTQWADDTFSPLPEYQSKAKIKDRGTPPADSTATPAMANAEVTQPRPMETSLADNTIVPLAKPDTETKKDLPSAQATSPAKLENQAAPTAGLVDKSADPLPHLTIQWKKECVNFDSLHGDPEFGGPLSGSWLPGATVEELVEEDLAEGHPWMCGSSLTSLKK